MYFPIANILFYLTLILSRSGYVSASSDTASFVPPVKHVDADSHMTSIRGLLDTGLEKRQRYTCDAPKVLCMGRYCCQNSSWNCCFDGSCCYPNYYCGIASNGIVGCCPDGKICTGPVDDPTTIGHPTTRTSTYHYTITNTYTTSYIPSPVTTTTTQRQQPPPPPPVPQPTTTSVIIDPPIPTPSVKLPTPTFTTNTVGTGLPMPPSGGQTVHASTMIGVMGMFIVGIAVHLL